jgi:nucleoside-diphosphate-sugar epimerase
MNSDSIKDFFKKKSLLITGGTGSFGRAFIKYLLNNQFLLDRIIVFSRDELKQYEMEKIYSEKKYNNIRYFLGDIRDQSRLKSALEGVDIVIHAAALKQVPASEYNPIEFIKTNIIGSQNIIENSFKSGVKHVVALSTDKASSPINLYGATKLCADKLFVNSNNIKGKKNIKLGVVRYGNVMGSRGSVVHNFLDQKSAGKILVTDKRMTRFHITLEEAVNMVLHCLINLKGGEIFVPKIPSFFVKDLAEACSSPGSEIVYTGIRPGEKLHEEMISVYDSRTTVDIDKYYAILPDSLIAKYVDEGGKLVKEDFFYNSLNNKHFLKISELKKIVKDLSNFK